MFENVYNLQQETKLCLICERPFTAHPTKRYCSRRCKNKARNTRVKLTELAPQTSLIHQLEVPTPTTEELDLLCKRLALRGDDTICKVKILPQGWEPPKNITCRHLIHSSNRAKDFYEIYLGEAGLFDWQVEVDPRQVEEMAKKLEEAAHRKFVQDNLDRMARVKAAKTLPPEELATVETFNGLRHENLTLTVMRQFCSEHSYNITGPNAETLTNELGEEVGKVTYHRE